MGGCMDALRDTVLALLLGALLALALFYRQE
jgi:hypothetical protein